MIRLAAYGPEQAQENSPVSQDSANLPDPHRKEPGLRVSAVSRCTCVTGLQDAFQAFAKLVGMPGLSAGNGSCLGLPVDKHLTARHLDR